MAGEPGAAPSMAATSMGMATAVILRSTSAILTS
jgi:hypothetical protein